MTDTQPTAPLPDPGAGWAVPTDAGRRRSGRRWSWLVAVLVVVALVAAAWFAGEHVARGIVEQTIRRQIATQLAVPADHPVDIDIPGPVLPQLIVGSLAEVRISSDDVPLQGLTADVTVHAQDVPVRGDGDWSGGAATVALDEEQLRALLAGVQDFPADTVTLDAPDVAAGFELRVFALTVPVGVALTPRAEGGDIVLTPSALRVGDAEVSAEALQRQFGAVASTVLRDWDVCIADRLPHGIVLTAVEVRREQVVADFAIDSAILRDATAQEKGTCP